jgi:hypothetical protein
MLLPGGGGVSGADKDLRGWSCMISESTWLVHNKELLQVYTFPACNLQLVRSIWIGEKANIVTSSETLNEYRKWVEKKTSWETLYPFNAYMMCVSDSHLYCGIEAINQKMYRNGYRSNETWRVPREAKLELSTGSSHGK